ncbi:MAG: family 43 glycosylhydrolase, partial [Acholeplasmatales bacterium]|nr:family 43 glycosylhydrolase [Acholeplasmatales bacterium]
MKRKRKIIYKKILILCTCLLSILLLVSCVEREYYDMAKRKALNNGEVPYVFNKELKYKNPIEITNQWGGDGNDKYHYGIGDPFVMKYNGVYYLYPSTEGPNTGIKVFTSLDMISWEYRGFCVNESDETTENAYAPEVIYYGGDFYLCQSRGGSGHFFYKSDSPVGPFRRITANLGNGIDGSFHINDDGELYFIHTNINPSGLRMNKVNIDKENDTLTLGKQEYIDNANLNHWIEGPNTIRRDGITYLTYTGNHVVSKGYRVAYSYVYGGIIDASTFIQPSNNVTLISTKDNYSGLGHSSNMYGPNLDSIYTAYHNRDFYGRRYNLDRYLTNGGRLTSNGSLDYYASVPLRPYFESYDDSGFEHIGDFYLATKFNKEYYTAEFNLILNSGFIVLNYIDELNYLKLIIDKLHSFISLVEVKNGDERVLEEQSLTSVNDLDKLVSIRVEKNMVGYSFYVNEMLRLSFKTSNYKHESKIGYYGDVSINYTAFSLDVDGSSDFEVVKNVPSSIGAQTYLKDEFRGYYFKNPTLNNSVRLGEKNNISYEDDMYSVLLNSKEDFVKYPINVNKSEGISSDTYSLVVEITKESLGSVIEIVVNEKTIVKVDVPKNIDFGKNKYVRVFLTSLDLESGENTIKFRLFSGNFKFRQFYVYEDGFLDELNDIHNLELKDKITEVASGRYLQQEDYIQSIESGIFMGLYGNAGVSNFMYSVDVSFLNGSSGEGGIVFRAKNYSYHKDQPIQSFQGYFFQIKERVGTLFRYDYGATNEAIVSLRDSSNNGYFTEYRWNTVKVVCINNNIKIYVND